MVTAEQVTTAFTGFGTTLTPILAAATVAALGLMFIVMGPKKVIKIVRGMFGTAS